eukprot:2398360-Amphidinium_carterae.1
MPLTRGLSLEPQWSSYRAPELGCACQTQATNKTSGMLNSTTLTPRPRTAPTRIAACHSQNYKTLIPRPGVSALAFAVRGYCCIRIDVFPEPWQDSHIRTAKSQPTPTLGNGSTDQHTTLAQNTFAAFARACALSAHQTSYG